MDKGRLLTPGEVAARFRVDAKTVVRWAKSGKLPFVKTLGGHHRFREADVEEKLAFSDDQEEEAAA